ncbi:bifunctional glutamate N-acetyltransferase/amino-acid acetyltransferase ArgJ [Simiduia sp. 21SJ11W-1]|uniref:bifunctional glutamate N-acetyltransferase/amino-acid acetyltransferase ArgJ n=1 Tax=Simiduia sp. 21SJ11W-1 TaxID=2909669 RepID=UPI0020A1D37A|nr:bifunctional glutamate N-acetyltransferase/amino-acid acetyltransferase ArgJ [Simiduia sp. 21SJ11W-1]UTA48878.1 bifunctional glutamate N-acetyltransferase/amino-acid acetyltransferase ArgJ [Simiduia sp. 21SJ11W-1]
MAIGEATFPEMHTVAGFKLGVASAGIKRPGRRDVVVMEAQAGSTVAGVFTTNAFCAAPVTLCKERLAQGQPRFFVTNTGNANACTGLPGRENASRVCQSVASLCGTEESLVLPFSTGVIGEPLPVEKILAVLPEAVKSLSEHEWENAAHGILTTDTRPKGASVCFEYQGERIVVSGIAKGSGMIKPNMATMLGYVATNAKVAQPLLQAMLREATDRSFNRITVDGDTSTNDSGVLIATGGTGLAELSEARGEYYEQLKSAIIEVHQSLAKAIVSDGEGATKFVTVDVVGAREKSDATKVAYAVAHSPLIKTALFASDPNWGRIVAAIGYAGVANLNADSVRVHLGDVLIVEDGGRAASYTEAQGQAVMNEPYITIRIDLGMGSAHDTVWTTDLSYDYVKINADYRS